jgi:hypothetical protein
MDMASGRARAELFRGQRAAGSAVFAVLNPFPE